MLAQRQSLGATRGTQVVGRRPCATRPAVQRPSASRRQTVLAQAFQQPDSRYYASYHVYKGKGAVGFKLLPPTWKAETSPQGYQRMVVDREGAILLEFAPVRSQEPQTGYGSRSYDWTNGIKIALKATEAMGLADFDMAYANLGPNDKGWEIFHDPNKGTPNEGTVTKKLSVVWGRQDGGMLMSVSQGGREAQGLSISVPVTRAEFMVIKELAKYAVPRMLGFDVVMEGGA